MTETVINLPETLLKQAEILARSMNIPQNRLFELALEQFISTHQAELLAAPTSSTQPARAVFSQGDIFWLQLDAADGLEPGIPHPHVIVQTDELNNSRINTLVVCALTTNLKRVSILGNVLLNEGEANLPKTSVVEVSKVSTVTKAQLGEYIGSLTEERINQIMSMMRFVNLSFLPP